MNLRSVRFLVPVYLMILALATPIPPGFPGWGIDSAQALGVFFEEDFSGCSDGASPTTIGWVHALTGTGTFVCKNDQFFPGPPNFPTYGGAQSFNQRLTGSLIDRWRPPSFTPDPENEPTEIGFAIRFEAFSTSTFGGAVQLTFRDSLPTELVMGGFGVDDQGLVHTFDSASAAWQATSFSLVLDTWYLVEHSVDGALARYSTSINGTQIEAIQEMNSQASVMDQVQISGRLASKVWWDWFFNDRVTVGTLPDENTNLCVGTPPISKQVTTDASTDVIFALSLAPSFVSINEQTGLITGTATTEGTFPVVVTANVSTGQDTEPFNIIVEACTAGTAVTTFGPNWVAFLAILGLIGYITFRFKRAFDKRRNRQGKSGFVDFFNRRFRKRKR